jgi:uncharacterized protein DUF4054
VNLTVAQFRTDFPEFADTSKYPDSLVTMWLTVALSLVGNTQRWGTLLSTAQELVTAHYLVLASRDRAAAASGATPGTPQGLVTGESASDLSTNYDVNALLLENAGLWNQTTYGQRYFALSRFAGAGGIQL